MPPVRECLCCRSSNYRSNRPCFLQRRVGTIFLDGFETFDGNVDDDGLLEFRHINAPLLEIRLAADLAGRVKLRRANAIRISPADLRALAGYSAGACHSQRMVA